MNTPRQPTAVDTPPKIKPEHKLVKHPYTLHLPVKTMPQTSLAPRLASARDDT